LAASTVSGGRSSGRWERESRRERREAAAEGERMEEEEEEEGWRGGEGRGGEGREGGGEGGEEEVRRYDGEHTTIPPLCLSHLPSLPPPLHHISAQEGQPLGFFVASVKS